MRIGQGFDVHRFDAEASTAPLILGGVELPEGPPLAGHSDGDVVLHALVDALLGAAALGDIGELVGTDDPATRGAPSSGFVRAAVRRLHDAGWDVGNVDLTVIAQRPRIAPFRDAMRTTIAGLLDVEPEAVSCKATTTDDTGALGRGEGIACLAVALISPRRTD